MKDKERYKREMQEYKERLKLVQPKEVAKVDPPVMAAKAEEEPSSVATEEAN